MHVEDRSRWPAAEDGGQAIVGDAVGKTDVELDAERSCDLVGEVVVDAEARDACSIALSSRCRSAATSSPCCEHVGTRPRRVTSTKVFCGPPEMSSRQLQLAGHVLIAGRRHLTTIRTLLVLVHAARAYGLRSRR